MSNNNLAVLKDKAYDVDADLRFMALDDFQKYLNDARISKNIRHIEAFIPILFKLLEDEASEVQNQAVKSFAPVMNFVSDDEILRIISRLFDEVIKINTKEREQHNNYKKFTTSIPNMALRSIFNNPNFTFKKTLSRKILDLIILRIFDQPINIDSIEILIDLFKNLGIYLKDQEVMDLLLKVLALTFNTSGISSKRSIVAFDYLLTQLNRVGDKTQSQYLDHLIDEINVNFENTNKTSSDIGHRFVILQVLLNNLKNSNSIASSISEPYSATGSSAINGTTKQPYKTTPTKSKNLSPSSLDKIFNVLLAYLDLSSVGPDEFDLEDLDLDLIVQKNSIREDALITMNDLVCAINYDLVEPKLEQILPIIQLFIHYDPLHSDKDLNDDSLDNGDFDDEIEFSDDDEENEINDMDDDENDGNANKLRIQSIVLTKNLVINFDSVLPTIYQVLMDALIKSISDDNVSVSNEAIRAIIIIINTTAASFKRQSKTRQSRRSSDVSMSTTLSGTPIEQLLHHVGPQLQDIFLNKLMIGGTNLVRFPIFTQLLKSLITTTHEEITFDFIAQIYQKLREFDLSSSGNSEVLSLYRIILSYMDIKNIPGELVASIIEDLSVSINDKSTYHNFITESLSIINLLLTKLVDVDDVSHLVNEVLIGSIINKIHNKQYSSDLRQRAIYSLTEVLRIVQVTPHNLQAIIQVYQESLNYEVTVNYTIENMIRLITSSDKRTDNVQQLFGNQGYLSNLLGILQQFISSSDASLYSNSLTLLNALAQRSPEQIIQSIEAERVVQVLLGIMEETGDFRLVNLCLSILTQILDFSSTVNKHQFFEKFINQVVNKKFNDDDNVEELDLPGFEKFLISVVKDDPASFYYDTGVKLLGSRFFIAAKIIAIIIVQGDLNSIFEVVQGEVVDYLKSGGSGVANQEQVIFNIQLLGNLSHKQSLLVQLEDFYRILEESQDEMIRLAASRAIGLYISNDLTKYLPNVLQKYEAGVVNDNLATNNDILLLVAIKQVLKTVQISFAEAQYLWNTTTHIVNDRLSTRATGVELSELKLLGDILSSVIIEHECFYSQFISMLQQQGATSNQAQIYTNVVVIKQLVARGNGAIQQLVTNDEDETIIVNTLVKYSEVPNIENKQAIISTVLTAIHNRIQFFAKHLNDVILPMIFNELSAKDIFKKTIPMGPYKCIIDEGLEIRKLSYELLYTIIVNAGNNEDDNIVDADALGEGSGNEYEIDYAAIYQNIVSKGLNDLENDVVVLSSINLVNLIKKFGVENFLQPNEAQQQPIDELIEVLSKQLNKKIRNKASTQEVESFEEGIKSTIRLSKVINQQLVSNVDSGYHNHTGWIQFYNDIKMKHPTLYNAVEIN